MCAWPRADQEILRLTIHVPAGQHGDKTGPMDKVIVWNGPRMEILEDVYVSTWAPQFSLLPVHLPGLLAAFMEYVTMIHLSLYFFNMLPLSFLDGGQFLDAVIDFGASAASQPDMELAALEGGSVRDLARHDPRLRLVRWKQRLQRTLHILSCALIGLCMLLGLMHSIF